RRGRAPHLVVDRAAALPADPGDARDLHLPRRLERLPLAPDRALRRGPAHAAGGPRQTARRARPGRRADDGRLGADRAAGGRAVHRLPARLHRGHPGRERARLRPLAAACLLAALAAAAHAEETPNERLPPPARGAPPAPPPRPPPRPPSA